MFWSANAGGKRAVMGAAAATMVLCGAASAGSESGGSGFDNWLRGGGGQGKTERNFDSPFDQSLARQWEAQPPRGYPTLSPQNIQKIKDAIQTYQGIVASGGWPSIPLYEMRTGSQGQAVATLRRRLQISGDLVQSGGNPGMFDYHVEAALKRFQARHGLTPTGVIDKPTAYALNVSAQDRLEQLRTNLTRLQPMMSGLAKKFVMVNIPAAQIEAVENGEVVSRHAAVIGKVDRQTPLLKSQVHQINFNPYWTVPRSIIYKDLVPKGRTYQAEGRDVLADYHMDAYDQRGKRIDPQSIDWNSDEVFKYTYRQIPWEENSLGFVKINFPNSYSVYMHDTPLKNLFGQNFRAESSGCVRVQGVERLVAWLLEDNAGWGLRRIEDMRTSGERMDVSLKKKVAVYFVYVTAWVTADGTVNFRRDVYGRDGVDETASAY